MNLPDWNIEHVEDSARDYRVHATYGPEPSACIHCGNGTKLYRHGTREQLLMDLPAHGKLTRNRYRCQDCGKTFLQPLHDVDERSPMKSAWTRRPSAICSGPTSNGWTAPPYSTRPSGWE